MRSITRKTPLTVRGACALFTLLFVSTIGAVPRLSAQVSSSVQSISLTAAKGETVTLGAPTPNVQALTLVDSTLNQYATPFSITVSWDVRNSTSTVVSLVGYFPVPAQALTNGADNLASSRIEVSTNGGTLWQPVTASALSGVGTVGGSIVLFTSPVTQGEAKRGSKVVSFLVRINLLNAPATSAGTYTGTLNLIAISK